MPAVTSPQTTNTTEEKTILTTLTVPDCPKMLREALCVAEHAVNLNVEPQNQHGAPRILAALIRECDRHRPLGPNGKHGDRHTPTCGCDDVPPTSGLSPEELADQQPRQTLQERLMALADDMGDTPFTAAIVRQFAAEAALMVPIQRPERHGTDTAWVSDPYRLDDAGPVWTPIVQQYAARELRVRELTEAVWRESQADETVIHDAGIMQDIVLRLRDALDPTTTTDEDPST